MKIEDVEVIGGPLVKASAREVADLESELWLKLPDGYREYVTKLGEGVLGGTFVRIYPPWRIWRELDGWRTRIRRYWFWDKGKRLLPRERGPECVIVGDTLNGDELVFHPSRPNRLFVLPRDGERVFEAGADLWSAIEWMCSSGKLTEPFPEREFEPFDSRKERSLEGRGRNSVVDPPGESLDDIVGAATRWAQRHGLVRRGKKRAWSQLFKRLPAKEMAVRVGQQFLVFVPAEFESPRCALALVLTDQNTGLEIGVVEYGDTDGSEEIRFEPNPENWNNLLKRYGGVHE